MLVSEAIQKMKGKIPEIAGSHISSRVLQVSFWLFLCNGVEFQTHFLIGVACC
jgi:hypothetical protein